MANDLYTIKVCVIYWSIGQIKVTKSYKDIPTMNEIKEYWM